MDIAYNNPRTYSYVIVCIGKILSLETDKCQVDDIYSLISKKFDRKPNIGYWKVWFQRLTIKENREKEKDSEEKLCQIAAGNTEIQLWNNSWLKNEYQQIFCNCSVFNQKLFDETTIISQKDEAQLIVY